MPDPAPAPRRRRLLVVGTSALLCAGLAAGWLRAPRRGTPTVNRPEHASVAAPSARRPLTRAEMEADLRQLAAVVKSAWAYHDDKRAHSGVNVDDLLKRSLGRLSADVRSDADFGRVIRAFMAGLKEGHAEAAVGDLTPAPGKHWPFHLQPVKEGLAVTTLAAASKAAGVKRGDLVRAVNGKPVEQWIEEASRYVSASTPGARRRLAIRQMTATDAEVLKVDLERPNGRRMQVQLPTLVSPLPEARPKANRFAEWQTLPGGEGYIRIPTFSWQPPVPPRSGSVEDLEQAMTPAKQELDAAFAAIAGTKRLILDLRGNPGGSVFLASYVAEHLLPPGFVYHSGLRRRSEAALRHPDLAALPAEHWTQPQAWRPSEMAGVRHHRGPSHRGSLVVLLDELCFSATDDLLACLQDLHPNVTFVGRPSHGGTGEPRRMDELAHSKVSVYFCIQEMRSPDGRLIEGRGTQPDTREEWSRDDLIRGRDPDLTAATRPAL